MVATDAIFAGSIPAIYEQYLVPLLFQPYADDLAWRVATLRAGVVLEIAAGTGVVTRALRTLLPQAVEIIATDLNEAMLRLGETRASGPGLSFLRADARQLPFADETADVVICQFGVMFLPDKRAGYREALRVLRPGGRYLFNVWDRLEQNEVSEVVTRAVAALFPDDPPLFFERTPFGYFDVATIRRELSDAGFENIEIETVQKVTHAQSAELVAVGLCQGTPLRGEIELRDPSRLAEATAAAAAALSARFGGAGFDNQMHAHVVTAHR